MRNFRKSQNKRNFSRSVTGPAFREPYKKEVLPRFTQNFVKSSSMIERVVGKLPQHDKSLVFDIGVGSGKITAVLSKYYEKVVGLEVDEELYKTASQRFLGTENVSITHQDFTEYTLPHKSKYSVFSNIPFSQTAAIIKKLVTAQNLPESITLFLQKDAAYKFLGAPYGSETLQSLLIKADYEARILYRCKKEDFDPMPRVAIVIVNFKKRTYPPVAPTLRRQYRDFMAHIFTSWNKDIQKSLYQFMDLGQIKNISTKFKFSLHAKLTEIPFETWLDIFHYIHEYIPQYKYIVKGAEYRWQKQQEGLQKTHRTRSRIKNVG